MSIYAKSKLAEYMDEHGLTIERMSGPDWNVVDGHHRHDYVLRLNHAPTQDFFEFPYFTGIDITTDPEDTPTSIFDMLVSDAWTIECNPTFEDYASEFGIDSDSRAAERDYQESRAQAEQFVQLIGGRGELENLALNYERL